MDRRAILLAVAALLGAAAWAWGPEPATDAPARSSPEEQPPVSSPPRPGPPVPAGLPVDAPAPGDPERPTMRFGIDHAAVPTMQAAGIAPDHATLWIGPWNLVHGWLGPEEALARLVDAGVTPMVHLYYWGDDMSPACLDDGCWSPTHRVHKDMDGWTRLAAELAQRLAPIAAGGGVVLLLETEFNKGSVRTHEPLDAHLAGMARFFHDEVPGVRVVLPFGNWDGAAWSTWDRAVAAADAVGIQAVRGSTRDTRAEYEATFEETVDGARALTDLFGKPVLVHDIALSTYPEPDHLEIQAVQVQAFFDGIPELLEAGVESITYRSWTDSPSMSSRNHYQGAEKHWGLAWADGEEKPAGEIWIEGVRAERGVAVAS